MTDFVAALADPTFEVSAAAAPAGGDARAIAVLPFVNASADPENEYFSDGITEELITALTKVEGLHVASRTSVFALKGAREDVRALGARLDVSAILEGSVRRAGNRLRITAQLTSVRDGRTLWSERYDRELADVFAIQDEIARTIVDTLRSTLLQDLGDLDPRALHGQPASLPPVPERPLFLEPPDARGHRRGHPLFRGRHRGGRRATRWRIPGWRTPTRCSSITGARRCRRGSSAPGRRRSARSRSTRHWRKPTPRWPG